MYIKACDIAICDIKADNSSWYSLLVPLAVLVIVMGLFTVLCPLLFLSARCPAYCCNWHGQGESGHLSGRPWGQRHGGAPGGDVRDDHSHCEAEWRQRQPPSLQKEWEHYSYDFVIGHCHTIAVMAFNFYNSSWNILRTYFCILSLSVRVSVCVCAWFCVCVCVISCVWFCMCACLILCVCVCVWLEWWNALQCGTCDGALISRCY